MSFSAAAAAAMFSQQVRGGGGLGAAMSSSLYATARLHHYAGAGCGAVLPPAACVLIMLFVLVLLCVVATLASFRDVAQLPTLDTRHSTSANWRRTSATPSAASASASDATTPNSRPPNSSNLPFLQADPSFSSSGLTPRIPPTVYLYFWAYPFSGVTVSLGAPRLDLVGGPTSTFS